MLLLCDGCDRGFHMQCSALACAGSARLMGTGTARPVFDPLLTILIPLLTLLAAARGPMALALRSVYDYYYYYHYNYSNIIIIVVIIIIIFISPSSPGMQALVSLTLLQCIHCLSLHLCACSLRELS
jgi:hypothetical protein